MNKTLLLFTTIAVIAAMASNTAQLPNLAFNEGRRGYNYIKHRSQRKKRIRGRRAG